MIIEYLRPNTLEEAVSLLARKEPKTYALAGGTVLSKYRKEPIAVVDSQNLGLNQIKRIDGIIEIGATATLTAFEEELNNDEFSKAIRIQAGRNLRNSGTIGGLVNNADGRSPLLTLLLALDTQLVWQPGDKKINLDSWLHQRKTWREAALITKVILSDAAVYFETVARSPMDQPILIAAVAKWASGRMRIAVGGFGKLPILVMDGKKTDEFDHATVKAFENSSDEWASAEYRKEAGQILVTRLVSAAQ